MSRYDNITEVTKFNPYHAGDGKFSSAGGSGSGAAGGKSSSGAGGKYKDYEDFPDTIKVKGTVYRADKYDAKANGLQTTDGKKSVKYVSDKDYEKAGYSSHEAGGYFMDSDGNTSWGY